MLISPPRIKWVSIHKELPVSAGKVYLYGKVNKGTSHESFAVVYGNYYPDTEAKFFDLDGDTLAMEVFYWGYF